MSVSVHGPGQIPFDFGGEPHRALEAPHRGASPCELVPVAPFRERFIYLNGRRELSTKGLARRLEDEAGGTWTKDRVKRVLGLMAYQSSGGRKRTRKHVTLATAERLARCLDLDPFEGGF